VLYLVVLAFGTYMILTWEESEDDVSPSSSPAASPCSTPLPRSPRDSGEDYEIQKDSPHMAMLREMTDRQSRLEDQWRESETEKETKLLVSMAKQDHLWESRDQKMLDEIQGRLNIFKQTLMEDRGEKEHAFPESTLKGSVEPESTPVAATPTKGTGSAEPLFDLEPPSTTKDRSMPKKQKTGNAAATLARLSRVARNPQQVFLEVLENLEDWDQIYVEQHFPVGFRARIAPDLLADIYASGKRGKEYALDWLRIRNLMDCSSALGLIATLAAIDTLLLDDPIDNFINHIGVEKLSKKAYGLMTAYNNVKKETDWKRPSGNAKWTSRVDWNAAKRVDPDLKGEDSLLRVPQVEDEVRTEIDREAALIKAKAKLDERQRSGDGP